MNRSMTGGNERADFGLFDTNARAQEDMFSDVSSDRLSAANDQIAADLRQAIEAEDFEVDLGAGSTKVSRYLDELDKDQEIMDLLDACVKGT